jgi:hypothetical protein
MLEQPLSEGKMLDRLEHALHPVGGGRLRANAGVNQQPSREQKNKAARANPENCDHTHHQRDRPHLAVELKAAAIAPAQRIKEKLRARRSSHDSRHRDSYIAKWIMKHHRSHGRFVLVRRRRPKNEHIQRDPGQPEIAGTAQETARRCKILAKKDCVRTGP